MFVFFCLDRRPEKSISIAPLDNVLNDYPRGLQRLVL